MKFWKNNIFFKIVHFGFYPSKSLEIEVWRRLRVQLAIPHGQKLAICKQITNIVENRNSPRISQKMGSDVPDMYPQVLHRSPTVIIFLISKKCCYSFIILQSHQIWIDSRISKLIWSLRLLGCNFRWFCNQLHNPWILRGFSDLWVDFGFSLIMNYASEGVMVSMKIDHKDPWNTFHVSVTLS